MYERKTAGKATMTDGTELELQLTIREEKEFKGLEEKDAYIREMKIDDALRKLLMSVRIEQTIKPCLSDIPDSFANLLKDIFIKL